jgi:ankyrin repeat protein
MRDLEPSVQAFVFNVFLSKAEKNVKEQMIDPPQLFALCSFYINGYGTEVSPEKGLRQLKHAAHGDHDLSRAYLYRLHEAHKQSLSREIPVVDYLSVSALKGSRMALQDLSEAGADNIPFVKAALQDSLGGTGCNFFHRGQLLHNFAHGDLDHIEAVVEKCQKTTTLYALKVNKRGDGVLHFAASCGKRHAVHMLINTYGVDVDFANEQGETALLCACRSGHIQTVRLLLEAGAKASITAKNGESPLHWLISFEDQDIESIGQALVANGADLRCTTTKLVSHSVFPGQIDVDHQGPGTPLGWAVHHDRPTIVKFLLANGADPLVKFQKLYPSPLQWAAFYHHTECLGLMIEKLEADNLVFTFSELLVAATHSADRFSMILRNGSSYRSKMHSTFDLLLERTRKIHFVTGIGGVGKTLLFNAVAGAHDDVVEYLLTRGHGKEDINTPCPPDKRTPVLECVRWNRKALFRMLVQHGADVSAVAQNPFRAGKMDWTALHTLAEAAHDQDTSLSREIVKLGVPADGRPVDSVDTETPFSVAIHNNAFKLASTLLELGADINALSLHSALVTVEFPMTALGNLIATNARYSHARLRYLLFECEKHNELDFIVEPERRLSALHRAAWAYHGLKTSYTGKNLRRENFDMRTNRDIIYELALRYETPEELNLQCIIQGKTALHMAVEMRNVGAVDVLVAMGADVMVEDEEGETPLALARRLASEARVGSGVTEEFEILDLLES